jgi:chromosome segregation ATPase
MAKKTVQELIEQPTMSEKGMSGITLTGGDRQFIKREFDGVIGYLKDKLSENQRFLAEILIDNNASFHLKMDAVMEAILEIKRDIKELRIEMKETKVEIKELKLEVKSISLELIIIHKKLLDHDQRLRDLEDQRLKDLENKKPNILENKDIINDKPIS